MLAAVACYELARLALRPDWPLARAHARGLAAWERRVHLAWEAPLQSAVLHAPALVGAMNGFYLAGNFALTGVFFLWLYRRAPAGFARYRDAFLLASAVSVVIEWRYPTAPPRLARLGLEDTLRRVSGIDIGSAGAGGLTDPVAALPSLHAGWAAGVAAGVVAHARRPLTRLLGVGYALAVDLTVVVTGNHFVVDVVVGSLLVLVSLGLVAARDRAEVVAFPLRRGVEQSGSSPGS